MLAVTRETLLGHLVDLPVLVDLYQRRDPAFPKQVLKWLGRVEESLGRLRTPVLSLVTAQRAFLLASRDGLQDPRISPHTPHSRSAVRRERVTAALCLERVEAALREAIQHADGALGDAREKLLQLLAVASAKRPLSMPGPDKPGQVWSRKLWRSLQDDAETRSLHAYLSAALHPSDRLYLLEDILTNLRGESDTSPAA